MGAVFCGSFGLGVCGFGIRLEASGMRVLGSGSATEWQMASTRMHAAQHASPHSAPVKMLQGREFLDYKTSMIKDEGPLRGLLVY